jgi:hypothetical protein
MPSDHSCVVVVPADKRADANKLWCAMGLDTLPGNSFVPELSADGNDPVTHYGSHAWEEAEQAAVFLALPTGVLPTINGEWSDFGLTVETALAAAQSLTASVMTSGTPMEHLTAVMSAMGLQSVVRPIEM